MSFLPINHKWKNLSFSFITCFTTLITATVLFFPTIIALGDQISIYQDDFEKDLTIADTFTEGYLMIQNWSFLEITLDMTTGSTVQSKIIYKTLNVSDVDHQDSFKSKVNASLHHENGNSLLRITFTDSSSKLTPLPSEIVTWLSNTYEIPPEEINTTSFTVLSRILYGPTRVQTIFRNALTHTYQGFIKIPWERAERLNDLDISLKARVLLEDDPEGHFKSNHSINCLGDLNITLNRIDEKHDHSHSTIASKEFTPLQYYSTEFTRLTFHGPSNIHESLINGNNAFILGISMTFTETNDSVTETGIIHLDIDDLLLKGTPMPLSSPNNKMTPSFQWWLLFVSFLFSGVLMIKKKIKKHVTKK